MEMELESATMKLRRKTSTWRVTIDQRYACRRLRELELWMGISNEVNGWTLYGIKIACMTATVHHGYLGICHFYANIPVGIFSYIIAMSGAVVYALINQNAAKLSKMEGMARRKLLSAVSRQIVDEKKFGGEEREGNNSRFLAKYIRSLPPLHCT